MKLFFRLIKILTVIGRYRLDELLPNKFRNLSLKFLLWPFKLKPIPRSHRGERLRFALEELGPIFIKFGQLLSTRPDVVPDDIANELNELQDNVTPFDSDVFIKLVENALGKSVDSLFRDFETSPLASASIAQVHAAVLNNGDQVVVKVVRPNIKNVIDLDIELMKFIAKLLEWGLRDGKRLRPVEIVEEYQLTINDELDLMKESANATELRRHFLNTNLLYVPRVYWDYCRRNVMVMERIYGVQVTDIEKLNEAKVDLKLLAERGVEIFFTQVFDNNFFHADMHPGNVYVDTTNPKNPNYIALDMAIMGSLSKEDQYYLARNLLAMFRRDYRLVAELHVSSGWVPKDTSIGAFESAIRSVCEPVFEKPLEEISFGEALVTLFQTARRFNMPVQPQLVLLQKTLINIEGLGRKLYPQLDLWATAHPFLEKWIKRRYSPKTLYKEFKRQAPEWLEKLPELPNLALQASENLQTIAAAAEALEDNRESKNKKNNNFQTRLIKKLLAVLALSAAFYNITDFFNNPINTLIYAAIILLIMLL